MHSDHTVHSRITDRWIQCKCLMNFFRKKNPPCPLSKTVLLHHLHFFSGDRKCLTNAGPHNNHNHCLVHKKISVLPVLPRWTAKCLSAQISSHFKCQRSNHFLLSAWFIDWFVDVLPTYSHFSGPATAAEVCNI